MKFSQWRTVVAILILAAMTLIAFWMAGKMPETLAEKGFETAAFTFMMMAGILAGKSLGQYAAGGGGLQGIAKALLTTQKPDGTATTETDSVTVEHSSAAEIPSDQPKT